MHAKDVANIIKMMIVNNKFHNMNIATKENYTVDAIAKIALRACDAENISIIYDKNKPNGQMRKDIEISKLNTYFPKFLPIKLEEGIKEIYQKRILEDD